MRETLCGSKLLTALKNLTPMPTTKACCCSPVAVGVPLQPVTLQLLRPRRHLLCRRLGTSIVGLVVDWSLVVGVCAGRLLVSFKVAVGLPVFLGLFSFVYFSYLRGDWDCGLKDAEFVGWFHSDVGTIEKDLMHKSRCPERGATLFLCLSQMYHSFRSGRGRLMSNRSPLPALSHMSTDFLAHFDGLAYTCCTSRWIRAACSGSAEIKFCIKKTL